MVNLTGKAHVPFWNIWVTNDGKQKYVTKFYNLDAILSVGYRVNSRNAALFRRWANSVLKEYLLKGHVINCRLEQIDTMLQKHERQIEYLTDKVDFFVRTSLPPVEGIFYEARYSTPTNSPQT